jgi:hypothetical protein
LHMHHKSQYILTILYPSLWDCSIANLAAWTSACCADLPIPWSVRIYPSLGLQDVDFQCSLPLCNMYDPSVNQACVCELSHLSVPQWPIFLVCVIFGMVMGHDTASVLRQSPPLRVESSPLPWTYDYWGTQRGTTSIVTP